MKIPTEPVNWNLVTEEVSITEHPDFRIPRNDWGVVAAYTDPDTAEYFPEDRSGWIPEAEGKSMADFWDFEAGQFRDDMPMKFHGISTLIQQKWVREEDLLII